MARWQVHPLQKPSQLPEVGSSWLFSAKQASEYALPILSQCILRTQKPQSCLCPYICSHFEMHQNLKETLWGSLITSLGQAKGLVTKGCLIQVSMTHFKTEMTAVLTPPSPDHLSMCRKQKFLLKNFLQVFSGFSQASLYPYKSSKSQQQLPSSSQGLTLKQSLIL